MPQSMGDALDRVVSERDQARAMLHEIMEQNDLLETENRILLASRNDWKSVVGAQHPEWMERIRRERREAVALAVDSINVQLAEHGIDMQFDPAAFIPK